jgi:Flp pilus assembly protein TadG
MLTHKSTQQSRSLARYLFDRSAALLQSFRRENGGVAAVEFAFIMPVMMLLVLGIYTISSSAAAHRKLTLAAGAVTSLIAEASTVTTNGVNDIFTAGSLVMAPFSTAISHVYIYKVKADGRSCVDWSYPASGTAQTPSSPPAGLVPAGKAGYVIASRLTYTFNPIPAPLFDVFRLPITMTGTSYSLPLHEGDEFSYPSSGAC